MVKVSRHILYRFMVSMWSKCLAIFCINSWCPSCQRVSCILPMWSGCLAICRTNSWCLAICRTNSWCPSGQSVSSYIAHVVKVYRHMVLTWSECIPYIAHVVRVSRHIILRCPCGQSVSHVMPMWPDGVHIMPMWSECVPHNAHVVRVYPM